MLEAIIKRLKRDKRGVSNVIVVMLSLVLIVVIVANVVLWSYQMNQLDWEKMKEDMSITNVERVTHSSWFVAQSEYTVNIGSRVSGTYTDTQIIDGSYERFSEATSALHYYPSGYILGGSTSCVSGSVSDLTSDDGVYMAFRSYSSGTDTSDFVDETCDLHPPSAKGTHPNFTAQQYGPDSIYDTLTEEKMRTGVTWYYAEKLTQNSQTDTSWKTVVTLTVPGGGGDYLIIAMMALSCSSTASTDEIRGRFYVNNTDEWSYVQTEQDEANSQRYAHKLFCVRVETIVGNTEFDLDISNEGSATTYSAYAVITAIKLEESYNYNSAYETGTLNLTTTEQDLVSDTISIGSTGYYLILASAEYQIMSTSDDQEPRFRLRVDGVDQGDYSQPEGEGSTGGWENWFHVIVKQLDAGNHDISIRANAHGSTNHYVRRGRIFAIRLTGSNFYGDYEYASSDTHQSTGLDFPQTRLTLQFTPSEVSDYLIISSALMSNDATNGEWSEFAMDVDGTDTSYMRLGESDDSDILPFGGLYHATLDTNQHTIKLEWGEYPGDNPTPDPQFGTCRIFAWKMPADNYELDLEVQWTNADYDETNEELAIYVDKGNNTQSLDATGGYMIVGDGTPDWGSVRGTISFWIKWDTVGNRPWGQHGDMETRFSGSNLVVDWGAAGSITSSTSFTAGKWYFIAIVWDENTDDLYLYVGDQDHTPTEDTHLSGWTGTVSTVGVAGNNFMASKGGVNPTDGHGDDLRYWDTDRILAEIQSDYDSELTGSENNLRSYFKLNNNFDDVGPDDNDGSGSGSYSFSSDVPFDAPPTENIRVDVWNGTAWQNLFTDLTNGWNNVSVSSYLDSSTFTIRFKGANETGDTTQDSWNIDVTLLHVWSDEYTMEVEFIGSSNIGNWAQLTWTIDSAWTSGSVNVTVQLYNYTLGDYPTSGNGYISYFSSATANTDETQSQTITQNPIHFRNATGYWKMKVKGVKATDTSFDFKVDCVELSPAGYQLDLNGTFTIDLSTCPLEHIQTVEIQLTYKAGDAGEKWYLKAYNWTAMNYNDSGFNFTGGHTPTTGWDCYTVNLTDHWDSYVHDNGTVYVKVVDEEVDSTQTTIDIDFLAVKVVINRTKFTFQNNGSLTSHLVSLWINNSTHHQRYDINMFINSGDTESHIRNDISLPNKPYTVKVVTERGNTAVFTSHQTE